MVRAILAALILWTGAAQARCQLALVLALDVSSSVDAQEYALQRDGLSAALTDPTIKDALLARGPGSVALAVYEWSGRRQSVLVMDWMPVRDEADIHNAALAIRTFPRSHTRFPTAMGYALGYGATLLQRSPPCERKVIDVSGDGVTNDGFQPTHAYRHFPFDGVTVNGLAVLGADDAVLGYYRDVVRHGPGAFVETSLGYAGYRRAMTRKLMREIGGMVLGANESGMPPG